MMSGMRRARGLGQTTLVVAVVWASFGCASVGSRDAYWGHDARFAPGWARVKQAAADAARSPFTWAPVVGAAALQIGDLDDEIAESAMEDSPIFGSNSRADDASDILRGMGWVAYGTTLGLAPQTDDPPAWRTKLKGFSMGATAMLATQGVTAGLKSVAGRDRPNDRDDRSFPSGHASSAAVALRLTQRNLEYFDLAPNPRRTLYAGLGAIGAMTAWARVEAGEHHLSDVLVGGALGNFLGSFFSDAFLGRGQHQGFETRVELSRQGAMTHVRWSF
jgi:hypothetical protein